MTKANNNSTTINIKPLIELLKQKRPSGDKRTYQFFHRFINNHVSGYEVHSDINHNYWVVVPDKKGAIPKHAFTSHYDTVHRDYATNEVYITELDHTVFTDQGKKGTPLGADDAAGIFIMLELIKSHTSGIYIFFADEESGGIGSRNFDLSLLPSSLDIMLSLDRAGTTDVIIEQSGSQGASVEFGNWLSLELNSNPSLQYSISYNGSFTDSANFIGTIPECANLSVGYERQHTKYETLDIDFMLTLISQLKTIDFNNAPIETAHHEKNPYLKSYSSIFYEDDIITLNYSLVDYVYENPELVAEYLHSIGVGIDEIEGTN